MAKKLILLVEDDHSNAKMAIESLEREDFEMIHAEDGSQALEMLSARHPDLILMDIRLPKMDGLEVTKKIRANEDGAVNNVPIIALTAHAMEHDEQKALDAGCDDYHAKPIAFPQLFRQINVLLE